MTSAHESFDSMSTLFDLVKISGGFAVGTVFADAVRSSMKEVYSRDDSDDEEETEHTIASLWISFLIVLFAVLLLLYILATTLSKVSKTRRSWKNKNKNQNFKDRSDVSPLL